MLCSDDVPEHDANGADVSSGPAGSFSHEEKTQMIHLRSHLNGVNDAVDEKTKTVEKTREEMRRCQEQIHSLEIERDATFSQIQQFDEEGNVYVASLLTIIFSPLPMRIQLLLYKFLWFVHTSQADSINFICMFQFCDKQTPSNSPTLV